MPSDYKSRLNQKQKKSLPGYLWLLSGLAIGLFVAFIIYLDKQPENDNNFGTAIQLELEKLKNKKNEITEKETTVITKKDKEKKEPKFNFYTILPELEVLIPESETRPPDIRPESTSTSTKTSTNINTNKTNSAHKQYVLQVGSFQNLQDAEKLKANLAFLGLAAEVQHVTVNNQAWHRVRTGPYQNKEQLYQNQRLLKKNDINAISMELK